MPGTQSLRFTDRGAIGLRGPVAFLLYPPQTGAEE